MLDKESVLVGIPAYNEEVAIGSIILCAFKYAGTVVVIDDHSHDRTTEIALLAGAKVISHCANEGKGACIKEIFEYAKESNVDMLVLIDGDWQHNPCEIPLLLEPIAKDEADIVTGSRFLERGKHNVPKYRLIGLKVLTLMTNMVSGLKIGDSQCGFRAFSKRTFDTFSFHENGMGIESEMLIDAAKARLRIKEVQVDIRYNVNGSTLNPLIHGFRVLGSILKHAH